MLLRVFRLAYDPLRLVNIFLLKVELQKISLVKFLLSDIALGVPNKDNDKGFLS
jgi:hypothetical protein